MMRIIIDVILILSFVYIGYGIKKYYVNKCKLIEDIIKLFEYIKQEINYRHLPVITILTEYVNNFDNNNELIQCFKNNQEYNSVYLPQKIITNVFSCLNALSDIDKETCLVYLDNEIVELNNYQKVFNKEIDNKGNLYLKLASLIGIAVAIMVI